MIFQQEQQIYKKKRTLHQVTHSSMYKHLLCDKKITN